VPPRIGRTVFATIGSTANISNELENSVAANSGTSVRACGGAPCAFVEAITDPWRDCMIRRPR
jgi:hypothetical protein